MLQYIIMRNNSLKLSLDWIWNKNVNFIKFYKMLLNITKTQNIHNFSEMHRSDIVSHLVKLTSFLRDIIKDKMRNKFKKILVLVEGGKYTKYWLGILGSMLKSHFCMCLMTIYDNKNLIWISQMKGMRLCTLSPALNYF